MRTRWIGIFAAAAALAAGVACESEDPCREYVDYICDCHDGEPGYDCESLRATYADPDPDVQDQCALDLQDLEDQDQANGVTCGGTATGS